MNSVQFASILRDFQGVDVTEDDPRALPQGVHRVLRATLEQAGAAQGLLSALDALTQPQRKVTLGDICVRALNGGLDQRAGSTIDPKDMHARFDLQRKIIAAEKAMKPLELESDDQKLIRDCLVKAFPNPWLVGQAIELIEGKVVGEPGGEKPARPRRARPNGSVTADPSAPPTA